MKKIITLILISVVCFALVSCSNVSVSMYNASYWLENSADTSVGNIHETNIYKVTFEQSEENAKTAISIDDTSSYKTILTKTAFGEAQTPCYFLETELIINGNINNNGEITDLNDKIITKTYFLGIDNSLRTLYSEKTVFCHSLKLNIDGSYNVKFYDYQLKTTYIDSTASVDFSIGDKNSGDIDLEEGVKQYSDVNWNNYIDGELLLFAPRAMMLTESAQRSFNSIDTISAVNRKMKMTSVSSEPTKTIVLENYFRNDEKFKNIPAFAIEIAIDSSYSGSTITAYYADSSLKRERASLIELKQQAMYGLGTYTYTIISANN